MVSFTVWSGAAFCQTPAFDVASVKPSPPIPTGPNRAMFVGGPRTDAGRATWTNVPLRYYTMQAYGLTIAWRIEGGPSWFASDTFDIVATFPVDTPKDQIPAMLKALLTDRFKLAAHMETREHSVYALTVGKNGVKIREAADDDTPPTSKMFTGRMELHKVTLQRVADLLSGTTLKMSDRPVVDVTGLKGLYDVTLDWAPENTGADDASSGKPSLFTAVAEQLGLRLEAQKAPIEFLAIDHAEKPSEN
jgi:uncharacterized protein (TIGR03435 family)